MSIRLGYQIPNFTYPGVAVEDLFDTVVAQARASERVERHLEGRRLVKTIYQPGRILSLVTAPA